MSIFVNSEINVYFSPSIMLIHTEKIALTWGLVRFVYLWE